MGVLDSLLISKLYSRAIDWLECDVTTVFCVVLERDLEQVEINEVYLHIVHLS